jgi:hypothetical protein
VIPAISVNELVSLLLVLEVTLASDGTTEADLASGIGVGDEVLLLRDIHELKLNGGDGETNVTNGMIPGHGGGKGSGVLSLTVALHDRAREADAEESHDGLGQRGRTSNHNTNTSTELGADLAEHKGVIDGVGEVSLLKGLGLGLKSSVEELLLEAGPSVDRSHDLVVEAVPQTRDRAEDSGLEGCDVIEEETDITTVETSGTTVVMENVHHDTLERVGERKVRDVDISGGDSEALLDSSKLGNHVAVGEKDTFRVTGGTRGVADGLDLVDRGGIGGDGVGLTVLLELLESEEGNTSLLGSVTLVRGDGIEGDNRLQGLHLLGGLDEGVNLVARAAHNTELNLVHDVLDNLGTESVVKRNKAD